MTLHISVIDEMQVLAKDNWKKGVNRDTYIRLELDNKKGEMISATEIDQKTLYSDENKIGVLSLLDSHPVKGNSSDVGSFSLLFEQTAMGKFAVDIFRDLIETDRKEDAKAGYRVFSGRRFGETKIKSILTIKFYDDELYELFKARYYRILGE